MYNIISIKKNFNITDGNYLHAKAFIINYIEVVKTSDYGYDIFNYQKIEKILSPLKYEEQIGILQYSISAIVRELPEHDKSWFISQKNKIEIKAIISSKTFEKYHKALFLYLGLNIGRLIISFLIFFLLISIILLPAPSFSYQVFILKYEDYSKCFLLNHLMNILSLFADIDNEFKIKAKNWVGVLLQVIGKVFFVLLVVNFIYRKVSDKMDLK